MHNQRGSSLILIGVIVVLFVLAFIVRGHTEVSDSQLPSTKPSPYVAPSPSNPFIFYSTLKKGATDEKMEFFKDDILKVSFSYPKKYFSRSYKAEKDSLEASLFFVKERTQKSEEYLDYVVDCILDNRIEATGLCRESTTGDLDVSIHNTEDWKYMDESNRTKDDQCEKEILSDDKVIYSCSAQLSVDPSNRGMNYMLYFKSSPKTMIKLSVYEPFEFADIITGIMDSAKISP